MKPEDPTHLWQSFQAELQDVSSKPALTRLRDRYLSRQRGLLTLRLRGLGRLAPQERPRVGKSLNRIKGRIESARLQNPVEPDEASLARGQELYDTVCAVCHGSTGSGDGPVGQKFIARPFDLRIDYVRQKPDGELFYTITNGSVVMPFYRDTLTPMERWDVVNYVKRGLSRSDQP